MSKLRTYAPMRRQSKKLVKAQEDYRAVYRIVDTRSDGRCEVNLLGHWLGDRWQSSLAAPLRCNRPARDHHHLFKPRRANHSADRIVHLCRFHHDRTEWPFKRGRLVVTMLGEGRFSFAIKFAADKFAAQATP